MKTSLIPLLITMISLSCTPTIERVDKHLSSTTDSALSILDSLGISRDTIREIRIIESSPVFNDMVRPLSIEGRGCDTVWVRDTVFIRR